MTDLLNSSHDLLNRRIEEAASKACEAKYHHIHIGNDDLWGARKAGFKEGARWGLENTSLESAVKIILDKCYGGISEPEMRLIALNSLLSHLNYPKELYQMRKELEDIVYG